MVRRLARRFAFTTVFSIGAAIGWCACFAVAFWAGKKIDADVRRMMDENPMRATVD